MEQENLGSHGNLSLPTNLIGFIGKAIKDQSIAKVPVQCNVFLNPYHLTLDINSQDYCRSFAWIIGSFFKHHRNKQSM